MRRIVAGDRVVSFLAERVGSEPRRPLTALGVEKDGTIIGGIVFNEYNGSNIEISVAGDTKAFSPAFIRRVSRYIFDELGCLRVSITTEKKDVVELAMRLGAQTEGRRRNFYGLNRDAILMGVMREDWKV